MTPDTFDVIVIGAGPAGEVCAGLLGQRKLRVALIENTLVGGECSYWGCMPSKALLRPAQLLAEVGRIPGAREAITGSIDAREVLRRRDQIIHDLSDDSQLPWLADRNVKLIRGHARIVGPKTVQVDDLELTASKAVIIATGTTPAIPPIPGLRESEPWTNREATTTKQVPSSLVVIGGGVIGVELGQAFATLGSVVTIVEAGDRILGTEEPDASERLTKALTAISVEVIAGAKVSAVERPNSGDYSVTISDRELPLRADKLLVATGRKPATGDLGLENIGLTGGDYLKVDDHLRVPGYDWLYAIGDVNKRALLTHMGKYQARVAADHITGDAAACDHDATPGGPPRVTFTDPQIAAVGHTLASATEAGLDPTALDFPISHVAGASFHGRDNAGTARLIVDPQQRLLGATFIGPDVAEMLHAATIAITMRATLKDLVHAVPAFPTRSEVWLRLLEQAGL